MVTFKNANYLTTKVLALGVPLFKCSKMDKVEYIIGKTPINFVMQCVTFSQRIRVTLHCGETVMAQTFKIISLRKVAQ